MDIKIIRTLGTDTETLGYLTINGKFFCYTLEDAIRPNKIKSKTCIPFGQYKTQLTYSPAFKRDLPIMYNRKSDLAVVSSNGDTWLGIRLHGGNTHLDTEGCPLVAYNQYTNKPTKFTKNGQTHIIDNYIQKSAEKDIVKLFNKGVEYNIEIIHGDTLKKETLYRLRNPMMKDSIVMAIQNALYQKGYISFKSDIDGIFGIKTENAVKKFQKDYKLIDDGIVGQNTFKALGI